LGGNGALVFGVAVVEQLEAHFNNKNNQLIDI